jgi:hypothetical protein
LRRDKTWFHSLDTLFNSADPGPVKHASLLLTSAVLSSFVIVACSASGSRNEPSGTTNAGGAGGNGFSSSGVGAFGGMEGNVSSSGGPTSGSATSSSGGTGAMDVGTWSLPITPNQPPMMGNNETEVLVGPGADSTSPNKFGGTNDPNANPTIVYPPEGVLVPPNMKSLEFHFVPAAGQTLF